MTFAPFTRLDASPWFDEFGATLDDATSFRRMIEMVQTEIRAVIGLIAALEVSGQDDLLVEARGDQAFAEKLVKGMQGRLDAILAEKSPCAS